MATLGYAYRHIHGYRKISVVVLTAAMLMFALPGVSTAKEEMDHHHGFSPNYVLNIDPFTSDIVGKPLVKEVGEFFDEAEKAIEAKDLPKLMSLYSEGYTNGMHRKADINNTWKTIFAAFNSLAMTHNMRFITTDPKSNVIIIRCSGILVGVPNDDKGLIALDSWMNTDHVLVRENGKLRIIGSSGAEQKRLWFDKPLHPLF